MELDQFGDICGSWSDLDAPVSPLELLVDFDRSIGECGCNRDAPLCGGHTECDGVVVFGWNGLASGWRGTFDTGGLAGTAHIWRWISAGDDRVGDLVCPGAITGSRNLHKNPHTGTIRSDYTDRVNAGNHDLCGDSEGPCNGIMVTVRNTMMDRVIQKL